MCVRTYSQQTLVEAANSPERPSKIGAKQVSQAPASGWNQPATISVEFPNISLMGIKRGISQVATKKSIVVVSSYFMGVCTWSIPMI